MWGCHKYLWPLCTETFITWLFSEISLTKQDLSAFYYLFHHRRTGYSLSGSCFVLTCGKSAWNPWQETIRAKEFKGIHSDFFVLSNFIAQRDTTKQCKLKGAGFQVPVWQMAIPKWLEPLRHSVVYWTGILLNSTSPCPSQWYWHWFTGLFWVQIYLGPLYATLSILLKRYPASF